MARIRRVTDLVSPSTVIFGPATRGVSLVRPKAPEAPVTYARPLPVIPPKIKAQRQKPSYERPQWIEQVPQRYRDALERHDKWLKNLEGGERATLHGANLEGADLTGANLQGIDFRYSSLRQANLTRSNLFRCDLRMVNLEAATLENAQLQDTKLQRSNLARTNLRHAYMLDADLEGADMNGAQVEGANLFGERLMVAPVQILGYKYHILIAGHYMKINCELHTLEEWERFTRPDINRMDPGAWDWWLEYKPLILPIARKHAAQHTVRLKHVMTAI